jgi:hypothetical protein
MQGREAARPASAGRLPSLDRPRAYVRVLGYRVLGYRGPRFARRFRFTLSLRLRVAWSRFTFDRFETFRFERFPSLAGMRVPFS